MFTIFYSLVLLAFIKTACSEETCQVSNSIRLYNTSSDDGFGIVQLCHHQGANLTWKAVCGYRWSCTHSYVACKQLGYTNIKISYKSELKIRSDIGFATRSTSCSTSYSYLPHCITTSSTFLNSNSYCDPNKNIVGLNCSLEKDWCTTDNGESAIRLINNGLINHKEGRIEYCHNHRWSPICTQYTLSTRAAYLACQELGFTQNSYASIFNDGRYGKGNLPTWFRQFSCSSSDNELSQCYVDKESVINNYCPGTCSSDSYVHYGIRCYSQSGCSEGDVRLVNGTVANEGRLEVCTNGVWGSVCNSGFSTTDAYVVCRQLQYTSGGTVYRSSEFGDGYGPIVYSHVGCNGYENSFSECYKTDYFSFSCSRQSIIGIACWDGCEDGSIRLVGGNVPNEGTVEICRNKIWGLISQTGWTQINSEVVCGQLNYDTENAETIHNSYFGKTNRSTFYTNVNCDGLEYDLTDCPMHEYSYDTGKSKTPFIEVVGVRCQGNNETHSITDYSSTSIRPTMIIGPSIISMTTPTLTDSLHTREVAVLIVGSAMIVIGVIITIISIILLVVMICKKQQRPQTQAPQQLRKMPKSSNKISTDIYENYTS